MFPRLMQIPGGLGNLSKPSLVPCLPSTHTDSTPYSVCLKVATYLISTKLTKPFMLLIDPLVYTGAAGRGALQLQKGTVYIMAT